MDFRVIDITASEKVKVKSAQAIVMVPTEQYIELGDDEIGFLEGKFSDHQKGIYMQGGVINPGWSGYLTAELLLFGECEIVPGQEVAHAIILKK